MRTTRLGLRLMAAVVAALPLWTWTPGALTSTAAPLPIDHVVVLMQENRSFDSYFGRLHFEGQPQAAPEPPGANNPDPTNPLGRPIRVFHKPH